MTPAPAATPAPQPAGASNRYWQLSLALFVVFLALDHLTKWWAIVALKPEWWGFTPTLEQWLARPVIPVIPGFLQFVYAENKGAAFSILYGHVEVLAGFSVLATAGLIWFWRTLPPDDIWSRGATALVLSGAVGNAIDRIFRGFVVDFIDAYIGEYHWPVFNIADSCICVGAVVLAWKLVIAPQPEPRQAPAAS